MTENYVGRAWQETLCAGEIGVAQPGGVDLDEDLVGLDVHEVDLLELELSVQLGDDEGGGGSRHGDGDADGDAVGGRV